MVHGNTYFALIAFLRITSVPLYDSTCILKNKKYLTSNSVDLVNGISAKPLSSLVINYAYILRLHKVFLL